MSEPTTEAGRALWLEQEAYTAEAVLAIEAEAVAAERERTIAAVNGLVPWLRTDEAAGREMGEPGAIDVVPRAAVLAAIRGKP